MGVDLRRRDVGMAEQLLHDAQVGAVFCSRWLAKGHGASRVVKTAAADTPARAANPFSSRATTCLATWSGVGLGRKQPVAIG